MHFVRAGIGSIEAFQMSNDTPLLPETWNTARLFMRGPTLEDADAMFTGYTSDPEVTKYLLFPRAQKVEATREFVEHIAIPESQDRRQRAFYLITDRRTGEIMGSIGGRIEGIRAELGYLLGRRYWNYGFMTEAVQEYVRLLFATEQILRVQAYHDAENAASARVLEKCGFTREGLLRNYVVHPNIGPGAADCYMWARVRTTSDG